MNSTKGTHFLQIKHNPKETALKSKRTFITDEKKKVNSFKRLAS